MRVYSLQYVDLRNIELSDLTFNGKVYTLQSFYTGIQERFQSMLDDTLIVDEGMDISTEDKCMALLERMEPGSYEWVARDEKYNILIVVACHELVS